MNLIKPANISSEMTTDTELNSAVTTIEEGVIRRGNMIKALQPNILGILFQVLPQNESPNAILYGRNFLSDLKIQFDNFVDHSDRTLYTALQDSNLLVKYPWLDYTVPNTSIKLIQYIITK